MDNSIFQIGFNVVLIVTGLGMVLYFSIRWKQLATLKPKNLRVYGLLFGFGYIVAGILWLRVIFGKIMP